MGILNILKGLYPALWFASVGVAFMIGAVIGIYQTRNTYYASDQIVTCQFNHMTRKFQTTKREAEKDSMMITVYQGSRTFMFRRDGLSACYIEDENTENTARSNP
jgi:hypothetical protein